MDCTLILLAAGRAARMRGTDKLLQVVDGIPLLRRLAMRGLAAGLNVRVTLPAPEHSRASALQGLDVTCVSVPDALDGMGHSIRAGIADVGTQSAMILPADMPEITTEDLERIARAPGLLVRATDPSGSAGHPVRFDRRFFPDLAALRGDDGARRILSRHADQITRIALPPCHATTDLDTPEEWDAWRARRRDP